MTAAAIRRLTLTNFRSYHAASLDAGGNLVVLTGPNGAGKTNLIEAISFLVPGRGLRRATLEEVAFSEGDGVLGGRPPRSRACWASRRSAPASSRRPAEDTATHPPVPDRPRAGRLGGGLRRPSARDLADAGDGSAVHRARRRSAAAFSTGWCSRSTPSTPAASTRWSARCARATGCWRSRGPTRTGSTPSSTRPPSSRSRSRRMRAETVRRLQGALAVAQGRRLPLRRDRARRLDGAALVGDHPAVEIEERYRTVLQRQPPARRGGRPHARRAAPDRPRRDLFRRRTFPPPTPRPASRRRC